MIVKLLKTYGPKWLGLSRYVPYPLRAIRISLSISPFSFWRPSITNNCHISEQAKKDGDTIWYIRFAWFQLSYSRWV